MIGTIVGLLLSGTVEAADTLTQEEAIGVALTANVAEMNYGMAMLGRAADPEVRAYAEKLVKQHAAANERLTALIEGGNIRSADSAMRRKVFDEANRQVADYWSKDAGADLDRRYMTDMIVDHRADLDAIDKNLLPAARAPEVKAAFTELRATIATHLQDACTLGQRLGVDTKSCPAPAPGTR